MFITEPELETLFGHMGIETTRVLFLKLRKLKKLQNKNKDSGLTHVFQFFATDFHFLNCFCRFQQRASGERCSLCGILLRRLSVLILRRLLRYVFIFFEQKLKNSTKFSKKTFFSSFLIIFECHFHFSKFEIFRNSP